MIRYNTKKYFSILLDTTNNNSVIDDDIRTEYNVLWYNTINYDWENATQYGTIRPNTILQDMSCKSIWYNTI